ncbi:LuxR C-terminal-related transcriptional regulator [Actinoplanes nipponensis]|uniref:DNA-binding response regulator n=1 Tax=Actinoplanes nipponensis TaxID=135950 RepID=A0A919MQR4_9ACTN|nr:response regulator transcription factor [Actinoplanes nipponensis]GIE53916.1 DNA-binding response regulator [Actinoplanes nipponensis]
MTELSSVRPLPARRDGVTTVRVLIADEIPLIRAGVAAVLDATPDLRVAGEATPGDVLAAAAGLRPDVVVTDLPAGGADVIAEVVAGGTARVVVLTDRHTPRLVCDALLAGAAGYLLKETATDRLARAVRTVTAAGIWLDPAVLGDLLREAAGRPVLGLAGAPPDRLTRREHEILVLMARGLSNAEIADALVLSSLTVRTHVGRVLMKLGVRNRTHAVTTAYRLGLVQLPHAA